MKKPQPVPKYLGPEYDWAFAHYHEFSRQYANQWIAFAHRRILSHGKDLVRVLAQARRQIRWREVPHLFVESGLHVYRAPSA